MPVTYRNIARLAFLLSVLRARMVVVLRELMGCRHGCSCLRPITSLTLDCGDANEIVGQRVSQVPLVSGTAETAKLLTVNEHGLDLHHRSLNVSKVIHLK